MAARVLSAVVALLALAALGAGGAGAAAERLGACAPGYSPCLPVVADLDCGDIPPAKRPVRVTGSDQYRLDRDGDGIACEEGAAPAQLPPVSSRCSLKGVMPAAAMAYYETRSEVTRAPAGGAAARSLCAATRARYADRGTGRPWALVSAYRYRSAAAAERGLEALCPARRCSKSSAGAKVGISLRFRQEAAAGTAECLRLAGLRREVVVTVKTCAAVGDDGKPYGVAKLKYDASFLAGLLHSRVP